jgi:hypothetical protein
MLLEFALFPAHDNGIEQREVTKQDHRGNQGICRHGSSDDKDKTAQIERIARVGVRSGNGEHLLLMQVAGGARAHP